MKNETVSVVIPAYNCTQFIKRAVDSALFQVETKEVLVVDDGSKDDLEGYIYQQYKDNEKVRYLKNPCNMGVAQTRNHGVKEAQAEYIAFLDADDWWEPGKLGKQLAGMKKSGAVLSCTGRRMIKEGHEGDWIIPVEEKLTYKKLLRGNQINCSSVVLLKRVALEFPMEKDDCHEDYLMWLRILKKYGYAIGINEPLLNYRVAFESKSGNKLKSAKMTFQVYRYMKIGLFKSCYYFGCYALAGIKKYYG